MKIQGLELTSNMVKYTKESKLTLNTIAQRHLLSALVVEPDGLKDSRHPVQEPIDLPVISVTSTSENMERVCKL